VKIHLYNSPVHQYSGTHYRMNPPLGPAILAAVLNDAGHNAKVADLEALQVSPQALAKSYRLQEARWPDALGFTVTTHNARGVRECIVALRNVEYDRYIALGGPHITMLANEGAVDELRDWGADAWVVGECEGNVAELYEQRITGLIQGEPLPIDEIPGPDWAHHSPKPTEYYGNLPKIGHPEGIAMWSRGCPHSCIFCANPVYAQTRIRFRPPRRIWADMAVLKDGGVKSVFVYDDELVGQGRAQSKWLIDVCEQVADQRLTWKCQGRCSERLTRDVLEAMYAAGCRAIMWGVESFSDKVLAAINKGTTEADIWHTLRLAHSVGIKNWLFLMVGNYGETPQDLQHTERQLLKALDEDLAQWRQVTVCSPVRGTELYRRAFVEGWLVEQPETGPQMAQAYAPTPWLSAREIRYWKAKLEQAGI
jgi:radical SAM superfamily enzyme YgiQ (UPF0313 family)